MGKLIMEKQEGVEKRLRWARGKEKGESTKSTEQ